MKRVLSFCLLLSLILPAFLFSASAAETLTEFVFYPVSGDVAVFSESGDEYPFLPEFADDGWYYITETILPYGVYDVTYYVDDSPFLCFTDFLILPSSSSEFYDLPEYVSGIWFSEYTESYIQTLDGPKFVNCMLTYMFGEVYSQDGGFTVAVCDISDEDGSVFDHNHQLGGSIVFTLKQPIENVSVSSELVNYPGIDLTSALDGVVSLIPVVLVVLVALLAVRKGISYLRRIIQGA